MAVILTSVRWYLIVVKGHILRGLRQIQSVSSVTQSCPTLSEHVDCSTPGFPVHHQLPELAQTHFHRVSDAISDETD